MIGDNAAGQRERQRDRMVGDFARAIVRRIAHGDAGAARRLEVDLIEADAGANDHPAIWNTSDEVGVDPHHMPDHEAVRPGESVGGKALGLAFAADCPVDIRSGCLALDHAIVGVLRVRREEMKRQGRQSLPIEIIVNDAARDQREVGAPVEAVEHVDDRQAMDRRLRVRPQFDRARSAPAFVHDDVGEAARGQLADRRPAVDVIDRLEVDVLGEIEMARQAARASRAAACRRCVPVTHVDAVARDDADHEVAAMSSLRLAELLRLAVDFAAMGDADVRGQKEIGRIGAGETRAPGRLGSRPRRSLSP